MGRRTEPSAEGRRARGGGQPVDVAEGRERRSNPDARSERRYHGTEASGDAAPAVAEVGSAGHIGRWHRARLQQYSGGDYGKRGAGGCAVARESSGAGATGGHRASRRPGSGSGAKNIEL